MGEMAVTVVIVVEARELMFVRCHITTAAVVRVWSAVGSMS